MCLNQKQNDHCRLYNILEGSNIPPKKLYLPPPDLYYWIYCYALTTQYFFFVWMDGLGGVNSYLHYYFNCFNFTHHILISLMTYSHTFILVPYITLSSHYVLSSRIIILYCWMDHRNSYVVFYNITISEYYHQMIFSQSGNILFLHKD